VCGRTFARAAALGAHRRRAHGIAGTSAASRAKTTPTRRASSRRDGSSGADRDGLLALIFPQGIPARQNVMREVNSWLDEADRLTRLR
jgi:hypothetical protein